MITRRRFFKWLGSLVAAGAVTGFYGSVVEAGYRLRTVTYQFTPPRWTDGLKLKVVMLADPHLAGPVMDISRWENIIAAANSLSPDVILLMGDYLATNRFVTTTYSEKDVADAARALTAPIGVYAVCGNHDWWVDEASQIRQHGPTRAQVELEGVGIPVLENRAVRLVKDALPFWLSGTASMVAIKLKRYKFISRADLDGTLAQVTDDAPIIHLAHEPDLFMDMPKRVSLTLSGHTHGGQVRLFGYSPVVPSSFGNRYAYGHIVEDGRHLVVSGGLGCSVLPIRLGMPPEITVLELG
jgi:uncharacterized protein